VASSVRLFMESLLVGRANEPARGHSQRTVTALQVAADLFGVMFRLPHTNT
jgi:hypothetical protein